MILHLLYELFVLLRVYEGNECRIRAQALQLIHAICGFLKRRANLQHNIRSEGGGGINYLCTGFLVCCVDVLCLSTGVRLHADLVAHFAELLDAFRRYGDATLVREALARYADRLRECEAGE